MAGIADTNMIDLVAETADGVCLLVVVHDELWRLDEVESRMLQDKLNTYATYIADGGLTAQYPQASGKAVRVELHCVEKPYGHVAHIVEHATTAFAKLGVEFAVEVRSRS